jgi:tripartite-type tricarboxylate transporter receptor subunit TctC
LLGGLIVGLAVPSAGAQDFYDGKSVRVIHGFGTGGGFDTAARVVTRHLSEHVPGHPEFVVESMPGAGSLIASNFVFNKAKPDGLTMGFLFANVLVDEGLGAPGVQFNSAKFEWLAAPSAGTPICTMMAASGIKSIEDWKKATTPPKIGAIAKGAEVAFSMPKLLQTQAGLPMQIIVGHKGGNPALKLAAQRGEIAGFCASLEATTILMGDALKSGEANVVVQFSEKADPAIPDVPLAKDLVTTPEGADLIRVAVSGPQQLNRVFAFPPGTPKEKVEIMRKALMETLKDPALLEDAKKSKVNINPVSGEEVERVVQQMHAVPKTTLSKLKDILEVQ